MKKNTGTWMFIVEFHNQGTVISAYAVSKLYTNAITCNSNLFGVSSAYHCSSVDTVIRDLVA